VYSCSGAPFPLLRVESPFYIYRDTIIVDVSALEHGMWVLLQTRTLIICMDRVLLFLPKVWTVEEIGRIEV
jgi:hypothetical protein